MEYVHTHLLTADQIVRILKEREIFVPNMDSLPLNELMHIFNKFAVPMSQRKNISRNPRYTPPQYCSEIRKRILPPAENDCIAKFSRITLTVNFNGPVQKRNFNLHEEASSVNPKRMKIT